MGGRLLRTKHLKMAEYFYLKRVYIHTLLFLFVSVSRISLLGHALVLQAKSLLLCRLTCCSESDDVAISWIRSCILTRGQICTRIEFSWWQSICDWFKKTHSFSSFILGWGWFSDFQPSSWQLLVHSHWCIFVPRPFHWLWAFKAFICGQWCSHWHPEPLIRLTHYWWFKCEQRTGKPK